MQQDLEGARLLTELFGSVQTGVYAVDTRGRVLVVNEAALRLLGRTGEDLVGQSMHELAHHHTADGRALPAEHCPLLSVVRERTPARSDDDTFWRADGTPLPVSWLSAPVVRDGTVLAAVVVFGDGGTRHVRSERRLTEERLAAELAADLAAPQAEPAERLVLLSRLSEALSTLDMDESLRRLARLTVGRVADWCVVDAADGAAVRRVAVAHADPARHPDLRHVRPLPPLSPQATGSLARALATGAQQQVGLQPGTAVAQAQGADPLDLQQAALFDELGCAHALVTPLMVRRQVLGAMTWVRTDPQSPFDDADAALAVEVCRRAALTLENARLYTQQRDAAEALQRSLLTVLPEPDHLEIVARYLPASQGVEIGGDWYDAFTLGDGATSLVIGDILGHDLTAAAQMGQVRNLLRGVAADRLAAPSEVLRRLDDALEALRVGAMATALLARVEQSSEQRRAGLRHLRWSSAGHLPPAVVSADGHVRLLEEQGDLMLGVAPDLPRTDHLTVLHPGDTVWLYTDGLVERSDQPLDAGLARLRRALAAVAPLPLDEACDALLDRLLPGGHPDDVALLVVRAHPEDRPRPLEAGPEHV